MPRTFDRGTPSNDKDPNRNELDWNNPGGMIAKGAEQAGDLIYRLFSGFGKLFNLPTPEEFLEGIAAGASSLWDAASEIFIKPLNKFASLVGGLLDSIHIPVLDPTKILNLPGLFSNFGGLIEGIFNALGKEGATSYVDPVEELKYLADQVSGTAQAVAQLQAANAGSGNSGLSGGDNFQTPYTGGLGPGWSITSTNGTTTYVDTSTGKAQWHNVGNANPTLTARRTATADAKTFTEFQKVTATVATPVGGTNSQIRVHGRMSDDGQHYVVAWVSNSTVYIAYTTSGYASEVVVDSGPLPTGAKMSNGAVLSLECGTTEGQNEYDVKINGVNAQSYTDTGNLITTSVNFAARGLAEAPRGWGLGWRPGLNLGSWYRPATLSGCTIADNIPSEVRGHGFRVYRETTSATASLNVGDNLSPHFDEIDYISAGSAWSSSGYTVPVTGQWMFSFGAHHSSVAWTAAAFSVHRDGALVSTVAATRDLNYAVGSTILHCEEGEVISPRLAARNGTVTMTGSSSGADTFFSGALMSS